MLKIQRNIPVDGKHHRSIITDLFYTNDQHKKPIVIFCHGYKGFKDWGAWDLVAQKIAEAGCFFIKFNFSHNGGTIRQPIDFPDLEAFGENNYSIELDDLQSIIDWVTASEFINKNHVDPSKIILIGHSRGGGIVSIKAAEESRITTLITWAGVSDYASRFPEGEALEQWKEKGVSYVINGRTQQEMPHFFQFYTNFIAHQERLTISRAVKTLKIPHLIVHGTEDPTITVSEAKTMHQWNPDSTLFLVKEANHVFGAQHPWNSETLPEALSNVTNKSISFILSALLE